MLLPRRDEVPGMRARAWFRRRAQETRRAPFDAPCVALRASQEAVIQRVRPSAPRPRPAPWDAREMKTCSLSHLGDHELRRALAASFSQEDGATATVLAHIAEFDARRLYLPAGYPSTFAYCVGELGRSEDAAYKRIQAARVAR